MEYGEHFPDDLEKEGQFFVLHHPAHFNENEEPQCWDGNKFTDDIESWMMFKDTESFESEIISLSARDIEVQPALLEIRPCLGEDGSSEYMFFLGMIRKINE